MLDTTIFITSDEYTLDNPVHVFGYNAEYRYPLTNVYINKVEGNSDYADKPPFVLTFTGECGPISLRRYTYLLYNRCALFNDIQDLYIEEYMDTVETCASIYVPIYTNDKDILSLIRARAKADHMDIPDYIKLGISINDNDGVIKKCLVIQLDFRKLDSRYTYSTSEALTTMLCNDIIPLVRYLYANDLLTKRVKLCKVEELKDGKYKLFHPVYNLMYEAFGPRILTISSTSVRLKENISLVEIDSEMVDIINFLNTHGYKTTNCCQGHPPFNTDYYISIFADDKAHRLIEKLSTHPLFYTMFDEVEYLELADCFVIRANSDEYRTWCCTDGYKETIENYNNFFKNVINESEMYEKHDTYKNAAPITHKENGMLTDAVIITDPITIEDIVKYTNIIEDPSIIKEIIIYPETKIGYVFETEEKAEPEGGD